MAADGRLYFDAQGNQYPGNDFQIQFVGIGSIPQENTNAYWPPVETYPAPRLKAVTGTHVIGQWTFPVGFGGYVGVPKTAGRSYFAVTNWNPGPPGLFGDHLYYSSAKSVVAVSTVNHAVQWSNTISHGVSHLVPGFDLYAIGSEDLTGLEHSNGAPVTHAKGTFSDLLLTSPSGLLYVGRKTDDLYHLDLLNPNTGERRQVISESIADAAILKDESLLVATGNRLRVYSADGSQLLWSYQADGAITAPLLVSRNGVVVFATATHLQAVQGPAGLATVGWPMRFANSQKRNWIPQSSLERVQELTEQLSVTNSSTGVVQSFVQAYPNARYQWFFNDLPIRGAQSARLP
jgi:hypothetical protein